ncbi:MAG TPA: PilN domain-containing protein [Gemmatimonadaceae bacterium]|nr:PilN domain-containing protein [Gemmatimonadaceae bacterium]
MISINLLSPGEKPGQRKSAGAAFMARFARSKDTSSVALDEAPSSPARSGLTAAAAVAVTLAVLGVGGGFWYQDRELAAIDDRLQQELADSARFATVIGERKAVIARRDSLVAQLGIIQQIDDSRYVWPHILDEISRALPQYTWITTITQLSAKPIITPRDTTKKADSTAKVVAPVEPQVAFQIVGNTVDIQALTRFMRVLEGSPFIQNVMINKSNVMLIDNREVTEFTLDVQYQKPDPAAVTTVPITLSVR